MNQTALLAPATAGSAAPAKVLRAATFADIDMVHFHLGEVITALPYYNAHFKAYEIARLSKDYLAALIETDPHHIKIFMHEGQPAGFMISGPQYGTLWLDWSYVFPEMRRSSLALRGMREFIAHWDNGKFHKIAAYTMPANKPSRTIMERNGFTLTAVLAQQLFGEDYLLYERKLTKSTPGYDSGIKRGIKNRLRRLVRRLIRR